MKTLDQIRAAGAYEAMARARDETVELARGLPSMLQQNGLLAVWAFLLSKGGDHLALAGQLLDHLRKLERLPRIPGGANPQSAFLAWVGAADAPGLAGHQLRDLTAEALAFAGWLKRAAEAGAAGDGSPSRAGTGSG